MNKVILGEVCCDCEGRMRGLGMLPRFERSGRLHTKSGILSRVSGESFQLVMHQHSRSNAGESPPFVPIQIRPLR
jgi:hypothetical protein